MNYWRMNLHPNESMKSISHTTASLTANYIGLGFLNDPGDLEISSPLPIHQSNNEFTYWQFYAELKIGETVAIFAHNLPFALVQVSGEYNYIKSPMPESGLWFNHFRKIENLRYFLDEYTFEKWINFFENPPPTQMTIQRHSDTSKPIYKFIEAWHSLNL